MKKTLTLVTVLTLLVFGAVSAGATTIEFQLMNDAPMEPLEKWLDEKMDEFEEETDVNVETNVITWGEETQRIPLALTTGDGANVMQVGTTQNPFFAGTGGLLEIEPEEFGGEDAFMPANLKSTQLDDSYYGVPWFAETRVLFYNTEMFEEAGVDSPPESWDELIEVGEQINATHGEGSAIAVAGTSAWDLIHNWAIILWSFGGDMLNEDSTEAAFNSEAGVEAMQYYVDLVDKGLADEACAEYTQPQVDSAFINGDVAMAVMGPWNIAGIEEDNPDLPYDVAEPPAGPAGRAAFSGGSNLVIRGNAPQNEIDASKELVKFLTSEEILVSYTKELTNMLPAKESAFDDSYYDTETMGVFKETLEYATEYPPLVEWLEIEQAIMGEYSNILSDYADGDYEPALAEEYLDSAAEEVNGLLE
ncbi:MAG: extracellular solute-binding protein [Halanaerobiales bacterium]